MVKGTQTIRWQQPMNCLSVFDHYVEMVRKWLKMECSITTSTKNLKGYVVIKKCSLDVLETKLDESRKMFLLLLIYCLISAGIGNTSEIYSKGHFYSSSCQSFYWINDKGWRRRYRGVIRIPETSKMEKLFILDVYRGSSPHSAVGAQNFSKN